MRYLLDTDHISFLQRRSGLEFENLSARIAQYSFTEFGLSIVSFHEQVLGANNFISRARTNRDLMRGYNLLSETLSGFASAPVLDFDADAITIFDQLRSQRVRVATMDLRIASIALSKDLILLTRNVKDFRQVPKLVTEDWTT